MKRQLIKTLSMVMVLFSIGGVSTKAADIQNTNFHIESIDTNYHNTGKTFYNFSNEGWAMENDSTGDYVLNIVECGDWEMDFDSKEKLNMAIATYSDYRKEHPIKFNPSFGITKIQTVGDEEVKLNQGDYYIELTDGTFGIYKNGKYHFQPVALGDWDIELDNFQQFEALIQTYISMNQEGTF